MSVIISAQMVGDLRAKTGAGLMDCKKALAEANGNFEEAVTILRKKGMATAAKKAGRAASEGIIESYIHLGGKVGVLLELNCETDFVAKNDAFHTLARDLCMQVAATNPQFVNREEVTPDFLTKEREIALAQVIGKPPEVANKIVDGKMEKIYSQICLMEQPFVKNDKISIKDLITEQIAKIGENIVIRRFTRYQIGE